MTKSLTRRARAATIATLAAVSLGLSGCTEGVPIFGSAEENSASGLSASVDEAISTAMSLSGATAATVGVWTKNGNYVHGYGDGVDAGAAIRAAQASQPVMCALLLDMVGKGQVSLDTLVVEDVPRQVGIDNITYGQLCSATSGLADFKKGLTGIFANNPTRPWTDRELLANAQARSKGVEPGSQQIISDTGSLLLARGLAARTDESIDQLLQDRVFDAAGMGSSYYPAAVLTDVKLPKGGMTGLVYPVVDGKVNCTIGALDAAEVSPSMLNAAGATVSTVTDLKRFYEKYLAGGFGGEETAQLVKTASAPVQPEAEEEEQAEADKDATAEADKEVAPNTGVWTFGLEQQGSLYGMSGAITGTMTAAYHDPSSEFTVVVSLNNASAGTEFVKALGLQIAALAGQNTVLTAAEQSAVLTEHAVCQGE